MASLHDDGSELTDIQTELMLHFQDFTGVTDITISRDVLMRHNWDLEIAIQEQLNINEGRPTMFAASTNESRALTVINDQYMQTVFTSSTSSSNPTSSSNAGDVVPAAAASPALPAFGGGFTGIIGYLVNYLFSWCYNTMSTLASALFGIFAPDERRIVTDPLGDVQLSIQRYNEKYGSAHPVFYQGTYAQALNDAKRELKFLAVYLHSEAGERRPANGGGGEVAQFCRNALADPTVIEYVQRHMLFWGCDVATPEGFRVAHSVAARAYPLIVIVGLRANRMVVMGRLEGGCAANVLLDRLKQVVAENDVWLSQARAER